MPIYDYKCDGCGHQFEEIQSFHDPVKVHCPACSQPQLRRLIGVPGVIFKGTGFYATDYKNKDKPPVGD